MTPPTSRTETAADLAGRTVVTAALVAVVVFVAAGSVALVQRSPAAALLIVTHLACLAGPGLVIRDRRRTLALDTCDYLGEELDTRKDVERQGDAHFLRIDDAIDRRWRAFRTPLALPAAPADAT
jgi:hypothetical protein